MILVYLLLDTSQTKLTEQQLCDLFELSLDHSFCELVWSALDIYIVCRMAVYLNEADNALGYRGVWTL